MKILRFVSLLLAACALCVFCGACAPASPPSASAPTAPPSPAKNDAIQIVPIKAGPLQAPSYGQADESASAAAAGANAFAFRLSAALARAAQGNNFVCSPYSVWLPLAALVNATDEASKPALLQAINASGISEEDLNRAASGMLYELTREEYKEYAKANNDEFHNPLKIANALFVDKNCELDQKFADTFMEYYRGNVMKVNYQSPEAVRRINDWASANTDGLIPEILQSLDPNTVAAIANAIYFSDRWSWEFAPEETVEDVFHGPTGDTKAFFMLREGNNQTYYEDEKMQAIDLKFLTGGGMYILLPKDGDAGALLRSMTSDYFSAIQTDAVQASGKLLFPRFSIESEAMGLSDALIALGVPLFDSAAAPLSGVLKEMPVWLSGALQKARIDVDEKGTTAAAVTVMMMAGAAMPIPTEPFEMKCDRPFVFVLYGHTYYGGCQILFTGLVNKP